MLKRTLTIFFLLLIFSSSSSIAMNNNQKVFNKLDKQEKLTMLRSMRKQEMSQINSQIRDVKSNIQSVESNKNIPLNQSQQMLLKLNQELTVLTKRKADLERMYDIKIKSVKNK